MEFVASIFREVSSSAIASGVVNRASVVQGSQRRLVVGELGGLLPMSYVGPSYITPSSSQSAIVSLILNPAYKSTTAERYGYSSSGDSTSFTMTDANVVTQRIVGLAGGIQMIETNGVISYGYSNLHGDVSVKTDSTGLKVGNTTSYGPYGEVLTPVNQLLTGTTELGWVGAGGKGRLSEETSSIGFIHMGARPYVPGLGRFTEVDPVEGGTENDYVYPGDPVNNSDLSGTIALSRLKSLMKKSVLKSRMASLARRSVPRGVAPTPRVRGGFDWGGCSKGAMIGGLAGCALGGSSKSAEARIDKTGSILYNAADWMRTCLGVDCIATAASVGAAFYIGIAGGATLIVTGVALCATLAGCAAGAFLIIFGAIIVAGTAYGAAVVIRDHPEVFNPNTYREED